MSLGQARAAEAERAKTARVNAFLQEMLASPDPREGANRDVTVAEVLDAAAVRAGAELAGAPEIEAAVRLTLGSTYLGLERYDEAKVQFERAYTVRRRLHGEDAPQTAEAVLEAVTS